MIRLFFNLQSLRISIPKYRKTIKLNQVIAVRPTALIVQNHQTIHRKR